MIRMLAVSPDRDRARSGTARAAIVALVVAGVVLRLLAALRPRIIESDGVYYARLAAALLRGDLAHAWSTVWPPLYPALIAGVAALPRALGMPAGPALLEASARVVSVLAGIALLLPVHRLARRLGGDRAALVAVALAAVHPRLVQFSGAALTEAVFALLIACGVLAWMSRQGALAGAALGLATLARPEGAVLALTLGAGGALSRGIGRAAGGGRTTLRIGTRAPALVPYVTAFLVVILPYATFVSVRTGGPSLGEKGAYNFWRAYRTDYARVLPEPIGLSERVVDSPELAERLPRTAPDIAAFMARAPGVVAKRTLERLGVNAVSSLPGAVYLPVMLVALAGIMSLRWRVAWPAVLPLPLFVLAYAPFSTDRRFFVPLVPFASVLAAVGVAWLGRWSGGVADRRAQIGVALAVALVVGYGGYALFAGRPIDEAPEHRAAGEWLAATFAARPGAARNPVVMSRKPWVAYYAGALVAELPDGSLDDVRRRIRAVGADVLVVDARWALPQRPALAALSPDSARADFVPLRAWPGPPALVLYDVRAARE